MLLLVLVGCSSGEPRVFSLNGITRVHTDHKIFGITYRTEIEDMKTADQQREDIELDKERDKAELDVITEKRQKTAAFWGGVVLLAGAVASVIFGYISDGWRFWGGMAAICAVSGVGAWSFEFVISYLHWIGVAILLAGILWTMWKLKDFSLNKHLKKRKEGKGNATDKHC